MPSVPCVEETLFTLAENIEHRFYCGGWAPRRIPDGFENFVAFPENPMTHLVTLNVCSFD
jgi:hypothetical protein